MKTNQIEIIPIKDIPFPRDQYILMSVSEVVTEQNKPKDTMLYVEFYLSHDGYLPINKRKILDWYINKNPFNKPNNDIKVISELGSLHEVDRIRKYLIRLPSNKTWVNYKFKKDAIFGVKFKHFDTIRNGKMVRYGQLNIVKF